MNRRLFTLLLAMLVFLCAALYGCGKKNEETQPTEVSTQATAAEASVPESTADISGYQWDGQTEATQPKETEAPSAETAATIPPENVQLGVVEGENDANLDEDFEDVPVQTQPAATQPAATQPAATQPAEAETLPDDFDFSTLTYESYNAMSGAQQKAVIDMFASPEEFMRWYQRAEEKYREEHPDIEIGSDGNVNLG